VVEAMLDSPTGELDLVRGLHALADFGEDLLQLESDTQSARIWIDGRADGK
jgi:hypothetical protein